MCHDEIYMPCNSRWNFEMYIPRYIVQPHSGCLFMHGHTYGHMLEHAIRSDGLWPGELKITKQMILFRGSHRQLKTWEKNLFLDRWLQSFLKWVISLWSSIWMNLPYLRMFPISKNVHCMSTINTYTDACTHAAPCNKLKLFSPFIYYCRWPLLVGLVSASIMWPSSTQF